HILCLSSPCGPDTTHTHTHTHAHTHTTSQHCDSLLSVVQISSKPEAFTPMSPVSPSAVGFTTHTHTLSHTLSHTHTFTHTSRNTHIYLAMHTRTNAHINPCMQRHR